MSEEMNVGYGAVVTRPLRFGVRVGDRKAYPSAIQFEFQTSFQEAVEEGFIIVQLGVRYHDADTEPGSEEPYLVFQSETRVKVQGLDYLAGEPQEAIPLSVRASLLGIALGTARGMIRAQTSGFEIGKFELPVVNPMEFLQEAEFVGDEASQVREEG